MIQKAPNYEVLNLGAAEEASAVFGEVAALCIQKQQLNKALAYQNTQPSSEDHSLVSGRNIGLEDSSPREARHMSGKDIRVVPGNYHGVVTSGGVASQSLSGGPGNMSFYSTPSPIAAQLLADATPFSHLLTAEAFTDTPSKVSALWIKSSLHDPPVVVTNPPRNFGPELRSQDVLGISLSST
ncbi:hypothetical protein RHMOL_Rhmol04G0242600 [Rhododendron molle]|uniref:Uncharacterized protein n=1 Tax=Rhododendron molle TaxID=49168 RepID=A0ACC0P3P1_RHOML|nr:hypothetical protein RHMOL_Rhmol04G0242600 [Rhododendron molle]